MEMNTKNTPAAPVVRIEDLTVRYPGGTVAANGLDLHIPSGQILAVVGESGSGKSTLTKALIGLLPAGTRVEGSIRFGGTEVTNLDVRRWR
ncbi:ATP-binding cassette domain-containing protein, partial [Glutamicibacter creatinolyticus]